MLVSNYALKFSTAHAPGRDYGLSRSTLPLGGLSTMLIFWIFSCASGKDSGDPGSHEEVEGDTDTDTDTDADADTDTDTDTVTDGGFLAPRDTEMHGDDAVSALLYMNSSDEREALALGARFAPDLLEAGSTALVVWGGRFWEDGGIIGASFLAVANGDPDTGPLTDFGTVELLEEEWESRSTSLFLRPVTGMDFSGDGAADIVVSGDGLVGGVRLFDGPLPTDAWPEASANVDVQMQYSRAPPLDGADTTGDGFAELLVFENYSARVAALSGPLSGAVATDDADSLLTVDPVCEETHLFRMTAGDIDLDGADDVVVACGARAWLVSGPLPSGGSVESAASTTFFLGATFEQPSLAIVDDMEADGRREVAVGVSDADGPGVDHGGVVLVFEPRPGSLGFDDATSSIYGDRECGGVGYSLAAAQLDVGGPDDLWTGAIPHSAEICGPADEAMWGVRGPIAGSAWASRLDEGVDAFWMDGWLEGIFVFFDPYTIEAADVDGNGRDDLAVWNGTSVFLFNW